MTVAGSRRSVAGRWPCASAVAATSVAVLGPDAVGGNGPVGRPVLDLLDGSVVNQFAALAVILASAWVLARTGIAGNRASVLAAAVSAVFAQPMLDSIDDPTVSMSAHLPFLDGWPSGAAVAISYSLFAMGLLLTVDVVGSAMERFAHKLIDVISLLVAFFARPEPDPVPRLFSSTLTITVPGQPWGRCVSRRGPPAVLSFVRG